jgi:hypothetical protein
MVNFVRHCASSWALMAHAYNPSDSGGRDQENYVSKPVPPKKKMLLTSIISFNIYKLF